MKVALKVSSSHDYPLLQATECIGSCALLLSCCHVLNVSAAVHVSLLLFHAELMNQLMRMPLC